MAFRPDGRTLVTTTFASEDYSRRAARAWDLSRPAASPIVLGSGRSDVVGNVAAISRDGRWLLTMQRNRVELWDLDRPNTSPESLNLAGVDHPMHAYRSFWSFGADGRWLYLRNWPMEPRESAPNVWALDVAHPERAARRLDLGGIVATALLPDGRLVALDKAGRAVAWDPEQSGPQPLDLRLPKDLRPRVATADAAGRWLAVVGADDSVRLCSLAVPATGPRLLCKPRPQVWKSGGLLVRESRHVLFVTFDPRGKYLLIGDSHDDVPAQLWTLDPVPERPIVLAGSRSLVRFASFRADGRRLIIARSREVELWDPDSPDKPLASIPCRDSEIGKGFVDPTGRRMLTTSGKQSELGASLFRIWDLEDPSAETVVLGLSPLLLDVSAGAEARRLIGTSVDGKVYLWPFHLEDALALAARTAGRNLTLGEWNRFFPGQPYRPTFPDLPGPPFDDAFQDIARNLSQAEWEAAFPSVPYRKTFPERPVPGSP
jgi:WD40 repeat protein